MGGEGSFRIRKLHTRREDCMFQEKASTRGELTTDGFERGGGMLGSAANTSFLSCENSYVGDRSNSKRNTTHS